jgi:hypothetical protein
VHRHEPVVGLGAEQRVVRLRQLEAHDQRLHAPKDEEDEGGEQVEDPDLLVIGRGQPAQPAALHRAQAVEMDLGARCAPLTCCGTGFH